MWLIMLLAAKIYNQLQRYYINVMLACSPPWSANFTGRTNCPFDRIRNGNEKNVLKKDSLRKYPLFFLFKTLRCNHWRPRFAIKHAKMCRHGWYWKFAVMDRNFMMTSSALLTLCVCEGNPLVTSGFPSQRPVTRSLMFSLICAWTNVWVNNRDAGDFRRHRAHYDVTVMWQHGHCCFAVKMTCNCWWLAVEKGGTKYS